jgi:hypothetical protein
MRIAKSTQLQSPHLVGRTFLCIFRGVAYFSRLGEIKLLKHKQETLSKGSQPKNKLHDQCTTAKFIKLTTLNKTLNPKPWIKLEEQGIG